MASNKYDNLIDNKAVGNYGENLATNQLLLKGHKILKRNYVSYRSEIDIVSKKENSLFFSEVKTRRSINSGYPEEAVDKSKIKQLKLGANNWIKEKRVKEDVCIVLNVISILLNNNNTYSLKETILGA